LLCAKLLLGLKEIFPEYDINNIEAKKTILEELIRQELLVQDAEQRGIAKEKDIQEAINEFKRTLLVQEVASRITKNITITEEEAKEWYGMNKEILAGPVEWRIREMAFSTNEQAKGVLVELLQGADFTAIAKERSILESAKVGGDLGYLEFESIEPEAMQTALVSLDVGGVSSIFKGPSGYYIIKLEDRRGDEPAPYEEVKEDLLKGLTIQRQQEIVLKYIDDLQNKIPIDRNEKLLGE